MHTTDMKVSSRIDLSKHVRGGGVPETIQNAVESEGALIDLQKAEVSVRRSDDLLDALGIT
jgi:hypothetical protein